MTKNTVTIGCVNVGWTEVGFRSDARDTKGRLDLFRAAICTAREQEPRCDVMVLPAGFFVVPTVRRRDAIVTSAAAAMPDDNFIVAFGVDVLADGESGSKKKKKLSKAKAPLKSDSSGAYPFFAYVIEGDRYLLWDVQQTGTTTDEVDASTVKRAGTRCARSKTLGGRPVGLLVCGETLSKEWRRAIHEQEQAPALILNPAHASIKFGKGPRAWDRKLTHLLKPLPRTSSWVLADHRQGYPTEHPVRSGGPSSRRRVAHRPFANGLASVDVFAVEV